MGKVFVSANMDFLQKISIIATMTFYKQLMHFSKDKLNFLKI